MIASLVSINRAAVKKLNLNNPYAIHKLVYSLFPGTKREFLYYEKGGSFDFKNILILSTSQPVLVPHILIESKIVPKSFLQHNYYAFQILLNPVEQLVGEKNKNPVLGKDSLHNWFIDKQKNWGFSADPDSLEIFNQGVTIFEKQMGTVTFNKAEFRGILKVENYEDFIRSFYNGIGRGKAFGFGLLQLKTLKF